MRRSSSHFFAFNRTFFLLLLYPVSITADIPITPVSSPFVMLPVAYHSKALLFTSKQCPAVANRGFCTKENTRRDLSFTLYICIDFLYRPERYIIFTGGAHCGQHQNRQHEEFEKEFHGFKITKRWVVMQRPWK